MPELVADNGEAVGGAVEDIDRPRSQYPADALLGDGDGEIGGPASAEVGGTKPCTEEILRLGPIAGNAGPVLVPELVPDSGEAVGGAVQNVDRTGVQRRAHALKLDADGEVGGRPFAAVGSGERMAKLIKRLGAVPGDASLALVPKLVADSGEAVGGSIEEIARPAREIPPTRSPGTPTARSAALPRPRLAASSARPNSSSVSASPAAPALFLMPELVAHSGQAVGGTVEDIDRPGASRRADALERYADGEVGGDALPEVRGDECEAEEVDPFRAVSRYARNALIPHLRPVFGEAGWGAIEHAYRPRVHSRTYALEGDADREVGEGPAQRRISSVSISPK
jgi:hypothetical protein